MPNKQTNNSANYSTKSTRIDNRALKAFVKKWHKTNANLQKALDERNELNRYIYFLHESGYTQASIAELTSVTKQRISAVITQVRIQKGGESK